MFKYISKLVNALRAHTLNHAYVVRLADRLTLLSNFSHFIYKNFVPLRPRIKTFLMQCLVEDHPSVSKFEAGFTKIHVESLLKLLNSILSGISGALLPTHFDIMRLVLLPLHKPNDFIEWRDQKPCIEPYFDSLVKCCAKLIELDKKHPTEGENMLDMFFRGVISSWPTVKQANTRKEVLLLHEMEKVLLLADFNDIRKTFVSWMNKWADCIGSENNNILIVQRALQIFKVDQIAVLFCSPKETEEDNKLVKSFYEKLLPALYNQGCNTWNPTVKKMAGLSIKKMEKLNHDVFVLAAEEMFRISSPKSKLGLPPRLPNFSNVARKVDAPNSLLPPTTIIIITVEEYEESAVHFSYININSH